MPILGVNVVVIQDRKVLLTKRRDFEIWCLPGGEVDAGETLAQATVREAREEVALEVQLEWLVGIHSRPQWLSCGSHVVVFAAKIIGGELAIQQQEVLEAQFSPLNNCRAKCSWDTTNKCLTRFVELEGRFGITKANGISSPV